MDAEGDLERGRSAYASRRWGAAFERLSAADRRGALGPDDLWRLGLAAELTGRGDACVDAFERAHRIHAEAGDAAAAARCAFWIGILLVPRGEVGRGTGWLQRARRLLERVDGECVERGYLLIGEVIMRVVAGELERAFSAASEIAAIGERFGDAGLQAFGVHAQGTIFLRRGRVAEGLALVDEAMVTVGSHELMPIMTGEMYCSVISACHDVYALRRTRTWTEALADWCAAQPDLVRFTGKCMVFRSEVMQLRGAWAEALREARRAEERCGRASEPDGVGEARYQQAEVHRLRGAYPEAEEAYRLAAHAGRDPQPGLSLLRLAQGKREAAVNALKRALEELKASTRRVRVLPAFIEAMLTIGDLDAAEAACRDLEAIARASGGGALETAAAHWRGAVELARGGPAAALASLRRAWRGWQALEAPYEAARSRELVAYACEALQDAETAALELDAARHAYRRLGAAPDLKRLTRHLGGHASLTTRELQVLGRVAAGSSNKAIAAELGVSPRTVERHLSNIFDKLGVRTRTAAAAYAYEHGMT